jgi:hypothetical protein
MAKTWRRLPAKARLQLSDERLISVLLHQFSKKSSRQQQQQGNPSNSISILMLTVQQFFDDRDLYENQCKNRYILRWSRRSGNIVLAAQCTMYVKQCDCLKHYLCMAT